MIRDNRLRAELMRFVYANEHWPAPGRLWSPPFDLFESDAGLTVRMEIAGMSQEDFNISMDGGRLVIRGERRDPLPKRGYHIMAIPFGCFIITIELPAGLRYDAEEVSASYQNGFLIVTIPAERGGKIVTIR